MKYSLKLIYHIQDELPELWNVLIGDMSFVGPRPDVPGYADKLEGEDRLILRLRPGITGPASLKYANEEEILAGVDDPVMEPCNPAFMIITGDNLRNDSRRKRVFGRSASAPSAPFNEPSANVPFMDRQDAIYCTNNCLV